MWKRSILLHKRTCKYSFTLTCQATDVFLNCLGSQWLILRKLISAFPNVSGCFLPNVLSVAMSGPTVTQYLNLVHFSPKLCFCFQMPYYMRKLPTKVVDSVVNTPRTKLGPPMVDWQRPDATGPTGSTSPPCCQVVKGPTYANAFIKDTGVEHSHLDQERQFREAVVAKSLTTSGKLCHSIGQ